DDPDEQGHWMGPAGTPANRQAGLNALVSRRCCVVAKSVARQSSAPRHALWLDTQTAPCSARATAQATPCSPFARSVSRAYKKRICPRPRSSESPRRTHLRSPVRRARCARAHTNLLANGRAHWVETLAHAEHRGPETLP